MEINTTVSMDARTKVDVRPIRALPDRYMLCLTNGACAFVLGSSANLRAIRDAIDAALAAGEQQEAA